MENELFFLLNQDVAVNDNDNDQVIVDWVEQNDAWHQIN